MGIPGTGLSYTEVGHSAPRGAVFGKLPSTQPADAGNAPADPASTESEPALSALAVILALAAITVPFAGAIMIFR